MALKKSYVSLFYLLTLLLSTQVISNNWNYYIRNNTRLINIIFSCDMQIITEKNASSFFFFNPTQMWEKWNILHLCLTVFQQTKYTMSDKDKTTNVHDMTIQTVRCSVLSFICNCIININILMEIPTLLFCYSCLNSLRRCCCLCYQAFDHLDESLGKNVQCLPQSTLFKTGQKTSNFYILNTLY